jgi:hypothetical protein
MSDDPANLGNLHDIVTPPDVSWWPFAPGWIILVSALSLALGYYTYRGVRNWRRNAYRREAIEELQSAETHAEVSKLLRRTALATSSRETIAALQGERWVEWLAKTAPSSPSDSVREALSKAVYDPESPNSDLAELRRFAEAWIRQHRIPC